MQEGLDHTTPSQLAVNMQAMFKALIQISSQAPCMCCGDGWWLLTQQSCIPCMPGDVARLICKYRPRVPVLLVTDSPAVARYTMAWFGLVPYLVGKLPSSNASVDFEVSLLMKAVKAFTTQEPLDKLMISVAHHGCA